jgi:glycosyltransferase involved in cell wall biosynthesis
MPLSLTLAVPGDLTTQTGGYVYDRRLVESLRALGAEVAVLRLPEGFPDPGPVAMAEAVDMLASLPADAPVIIDGLAFGALPPEGVARIAAPIIALVHHPLALETALDPALAQSLRARETANLAQARHVFVPSPHTGAVLAESYGVPEGQMTVLIPGTDRPAPPVAPALPEGADQDSPLILSVGILHPRKGHDVLIDALARIADLPWRAVIAGTPREEAYAAALAAQVEAAGLGARIRLAGQVSDAERDALYRAAGVFALATRYEGYGIVFNEALLHGLPIVTCRTGAVPDTVPPETGLLVPPDDAAAFADALRLLIGDRPRRAAMARASARAGAALPSWAETARKAAGVLSALRGQP